MADDDVVVLQSGDGQDFKVEVKVAKISETIKNLMEDAGVDHAVPLVNVTGAILRRIVEYCKYHTENTAAAVKPSEGGEKRDEGVICEWDTKFMEGVERPVLFEMILAANYLDIPSILDMLCKTCANMFKGDTPEEIMKKFGVTEPFTEEEMEQVRRENEWCEEK